MTLLVAWVQGSGFTRFRGPVQGVHRVHRFISSRVHNDPSMTFEAFAAAREEPRGLPLALRALWYDIRGDWETAHRLITDVEDDASAWVHAYLHRKEEDLPNARYWYRRAGRPEFRGSLAEECRAIACSLLADAGRSG